MGDVGMSVEQANAEAKSRAGARPTPGEAQAKGEDGAERKGSWRRFDGAKDRVDAEAKRRHENGDMRLLLFSVITTVFITSPSTLSLPRMTDISQKDGLNWGRKVSPSTPALQLLKEGELLPQALKMN